MRENLNSTSAGFKHKWEEREGGKKEGRRQEQSPSHPDKGQFSIPAGWTFTGLPSGIPNNLFLKLRKNNNNICLKTVFLSEFSAWQPLPPYPSSCRSGGSAWGSLWCRTWRPCSPGPGNWLCGGFQVHEGSCSIKHPHSGKMGAARAEGFGPSPCGAEVKDTGQDEGIGN